MIQSFYKSLIATVTIIAFSTVSLAATCPKVVPESPTEFCLKAEKKWLNTITIYSTDGDKLGEFTSSDGNSEMELTDNNGKYAGESDSDFSKRGRRSFVENCKGDTQKSISDSDFDVYHTDGEQIKTGYQIYDKDDNLLAYVKKSEVKKSTLNVRKLDGSVIATIKRPKAGTKCKKDEWEVTTTERADPNDVLFLAGLLGMETLGFLSTSSRVGWGLGIGVPLLIIFGWQFYCICRSRHPRKPGFVSVPHGEVPNVPVEVEMPPEAPAVAGNEQ